MFQKNVLRSRFTPQSSLEENSRSGCDTFRSLQYSILQNFNSSFN